MVDAAIAFKIAGAYLRVAVNRSLLEALELNGASAVHSLANGSGRFAGVFAGQFLIAQRRNFYLNIDPIE